MSVHGTRESIVLSFLAVVLLLVATSPLTAQPLELTGPESSLGCDVVRGDMVAFLAPGGIVFLATRPFYAGQKVGTITAGRLAGTLPGYGALDLEVAAAPPGGEVFGLFDRSLAVGDQRGCFGFGVRRFSDIDDLKTYLHWWVRRVLRPLALAAGEPAPSVWLAGRTVTIEVEVAGHAAIRLRAPEGSTFGFQPTGSERKLFFQPFVVGRADRHAAVRVSVKQGEYFGPGSTTEVAFVSIGPDEPVPVPTDPPFTVRLAALEDSVSFVN